MCQRFCELGGILVGSREVGTLFCKVTVAHSWPHLTLHMTNISKVGFVITEGKR